jgi:beta-glucosidase
VQHLGSAVTRPRKDLRGYARITLRPGETRTVQLPLGASSLAYWNADGHRWVVEEEPARIQVGASSTDIRLEATLRVRR